MFVQISECQAPLHKCTVKTPTVKPPYIEGRQHVFVCEDLTHLRYKLLKYMQKSCSHMFTSCYTRNGNIKAKLKITEKWVTITSPDDLLKHGVDVDCKQMGCGEVLNN